MVVHVPLLDTAMYHVQMPKGRNTFQQPMERTTVEVFIGGVLGWMASLQLPLFAKVAFFLVAGGLLSHISFRSPWTYRWSVSVKLATCAACWLVIGIVALPSIYSQYLHENSKYALEGDRKSRFLNSLKEPNTKRIKLLLSCPINDEQACIEAGAYFYHLKTAGFTFVSLEVERSLMGVPRKGLSIAARTDYPEPTLEGTWSIVTPERTALTKAFKDVGISVENMSERNLPKDVLRIHFGPEP